MIAPPPGPPRPPPRPPAPVSRRVTGVPGFSYAASDLRWNTLRGPAPGSRIHERVMCDARSDSLRNAMPESVYEMPLNRHSVFAISDAALENGAASDMTLSRNGTFVRGSPPSSASVHISVAGWSARQCTARGPVSTPEIGTPSRDGRLAICFATSPVRDQTSTSCANPFIGMLWEHGFFAFVTSTH